MQALKSPVVAGLLALLCLMSSVGLMVEDAAEIVGLSPANTLVSNKYVWNMVTCFFFETNIVKLFLCAAMLVLVVVQKKEYLVVQSHEQFGIYLLFSIVVSTALHSAYYFARFFATNLEEYLTEPTYGFYPVLIIVAMYIRAFRTNCTVFSAQQVSSESQFAVVQGFITFNNLPVILFLVQFLCFCLGGPLKSFAKELSFSSLSLVLSWTFVRFYYKFVDEYGNSSLPEGVPCTRGEYGAGGEPLSFVNMFPAPLHIVLSPLTTAFYNLVAITGLLPALEGTPAVKTNSHHLFQSTDWKTNAANVSQGQAKSPLGKAERPDVQERRRARALKLLDAKMAELKSLADGDEEEELGWDDDLEDGKGKQDEDKDKGKGKEGQE